MGDVTEFRRRVSAPAQQSVDEKTRQYIRDFFGREMEQLIFKSLPQVPGDNR